MIAFLKSLFTSTEDKIHNAEKVVRADFGAALTQLALFAHSLEERIRHLEEKDAPKVEAAVEKVATDVKTDVGA